MAFRFTYEVDGVQLMNRAFNRVEGHIEDLTPVWDNLETVIYKIEEEQFKSEGARGNGAWKPLSPSYAKQKAKKYPGKPILQATGRLYASLTGNTADSILIKKKDEFALGSSLFYGKLHQSGTGKMPKRPPMDFSESQKRDIQKEVQKGLLAILRRDPAVSSALNFD